MADVIDDEELIATRRLNGVDDDLYKEEKKAIEAGKEIAEKFKRLYLKAFNNEKITDKNRLSYLECALLSDFIEKLQKENEELKESKITYEKVRDIQEKNRNIVDNKYIPKQKIKDIIDRIDYDIEKTKEIIFKNTSVYATYRKNDYQIVRLRAMNTKSLDIKKRLQKLLESEKK